MTTIPAASDTPFPDEDAPAEELVQADPLQRVWTPPRNLYGKLATVQNDALATRIIGAAFILFLLGGINALLITMLASSMPHAVESANRWNGAIR